VNFNVLYQPSDKAYLPSNDGFFNLITRHNLIASDKTNFIEVIDREPKYQYMFLRPSRWGKSTFLHMLASYYDKGKADKFTDMFGQLYIGKKPTPCRSTLLVLLFDFSTIPTFSGADMEDLFHRDINEVLDHFLQDNARFLGNPDSRKLIDKNSTVSLKRVLVSTPQAVVSLSISWACRL
jgi:hypothetical protein